MTMEKDTILLGAEDVAVRELEEAITCAIRDGSTYLEQCVTDYQTRRCLWAGQSPDGRKHKGASDEKEPFPFEGASDVRIRLADEIVNDAVALMLAGMKRALMQAGPMESSDTQTAAQVTTYLRWLLPVAMKQNLRIELPLLANWQETYGVSVLAVTWDEETRTRLRTVALDEIVNGVRTLAELAVENPDLADEARTAAERLGALYDETRDEELTDWLQELYEDMKPRQARKALLDLRTKQECKVPEKLRMRNKPQWTARRVFQDVFFPANTTDLQRAPWIADREALTPVELRARVLSDDYDEGTVEEAIGKRTKTTIVKLPETVEMSDRMVVDDMEGLVEVFHVWRKIVDEDGATNLKVTSFVPGVEDPLTEYTVDFAHERLPFVEFVRMRTERVLLENRSVPELAESHQSEIKSQRDARVDRTSLSISPPVEVPIQRAKETLRFGPRVQIPYRRQGEIAWMTPPPFDADTINIEEQTRRDVDSYFARAADSVHPTRQGVYQQRAIDDWLGGLVLATMQTLALTVQYDRESWERVTGFPCPFESGADVERMCDLLLDFNAQDLNLEYVLKKLDVVNKGILPMDTMGLTDRSVIVQWAMRSVDPVIAQQAVRSVQAASTQEIEDEQMQLTKIMAGIEPERKEGLNYALRLQTLEQAIARNPELQQELARKPNSAQILQARMEFFQFQLTQEQNAQIGRMGAAYALGQPAQMQG